MRFMKSLAPYLLIFLGALGLLLTSFVVWKYYLPAAPTFHTATISQVSDPVPTPVFASPPVRIKIPDLNIDLPVYQAEIISGYWPTNRTGVLHILSTPVPGEVGNSVLYGHDWPKLLGSLPQSQPGQIITVESADQSSRDFIITFTQTVTPDDISILAPTQDHRITLYTCTGLFDQSRFVVTAILK